MTIDRGEKRAVIMHIVLTALLDEDIGEPDLEHTFGPTYGWNRIAMRAFVDRVVRDLLKIFGSFNPSPFGAQFADTHLPLSVSVLITDLDARIDV